MSCEKMIPLRIVRHKLDALESLVSGMYYELHTLTQTWGRPGDAGEDLVFATDVEGMIRRVQKAIVEATCSLTQPPPGGQPLPTADEGRGAPWNACNKTTL